MTLNILYCSDNNYAPYLGISMTSLLENNKDADEIVIYTVLSGVSDENKEALNKQVSLFGESRRLVIVDGDEWARRLDELGLLPYRGSQAANLRLLFAEYIDPGVKRLLYLDCDTLVVGDLGELFDMDMGESAAAVVLDSLSDGPYKHLVGFSKSDTYFNSGVILFDIESWTHLNCQRRMSELIDKTKYALPNNDQDLLNLLLANNKIIVSPKYNFQTTHKAYGNERYFKTYSHGSYYSSAELDEARSAPVILHAYRFLGQFPWHENAMHPWRNEFLKYKQNSMWADVADTPNRSKIFAAERIAYKIIPSAIFLPVFRRVQISFFRKKVKKLRKMRKGNSQK